MWWNNFVCNICVYEIIEEMFLFIQIKWHVKKKTSQRKDYEVKSIWRPKRLIDRRYARIYIIVKYFYKHNITKVK